MRLVILEDNGLMNKPTYTIERMYTINKNGTVLRNGWKLVADGRHVVDGYHYKADAKAAMEACIKEDQALLNNLTQRSGTT